MGSSLDYCPLAKALENLGDRWSLLVPELVRALPTWFRGTERLPPIAHTAAAGVVA